MEVLHVISVIAPKIFWGIAATLIISRVLIHISHKIVLSSLEENKRIGIELAELENKCNSDCPVTGGKYDGMSPCDGVQKLKELKKRNKKSKIVATILYIFTMSPLGKLLFFIGNIDAFNTRRQS